MYVIKASGEKEEFKPKKVLGTLLRAGASRKLAGEIVKKVEARVHDGIKTREILDTALGLLKNKKPEVGAIYDLKRAIMELGPTGFPFERFFAEVLKNYGYQTQVEKNFKGKNVTHEVDIIAKKDSTYMIENKYHNSLGIYTNLKVALYVYARFLDLKKNFDYPWLATNTRLSRKAVAYAKGVNMKITSWQYPKNESLQKLIEDKKLYPITILKSVNKSVKWKLSNSGIVLVKNLFDYNLQELRKKTKLQEDLLKKAVEEARKIYEVKTKK
jgi:hypothetical protein